MTFYLVSALFKKVTLCRTLSRVSLVYLCGAERDRRRAASCKGVHSIYPRAQSVIVPNPNAPGVQMNRWSRWRKFAYPARYRVRNIPS